MSQVINVVQLGSFGRKLTPPTGSNIKIHKDPSISELKDVFVNVLILYRPITDDEFYYYDKNLEAYCLIVSQDVDVQTNGFTKLLFESKVGRVLDNTKIKNFVKKEVFDFFKSVPGEKLIAKDLLVSKKFNGLVKFNGNESIELEGDFGDSFSQVLYWPSNIQIDANASKDFWLEYECDDSVVINVSITKFIYGHVSMAEQVLTYTQSEIDESFVLSNSNEKGNLFVSILAKGKGKLKIKTLHHRYSHGTNGYLQVGDNRLVLPNKEEIFYYFDPMNMTPPLNVCFSDFGFVESYSNCKLMKEFKHPYLIIHDPRLETGEFYIGNKKYEKSILGIITDCLKTLGFKKNQLILSGVSMGAYGALYYGSKILPHAVIVGKPVVNLGTVAKNVGAFDSGEMRITLDLLNKYGGGLDDEAIEKLNNRFWKEFDEADWGKSKLAVTYMIDDEYDINAYQMLQEHLDDKGAIILGKGINGRHNDDDYTLYGWFIDQYNEIIEKDFDRKN